MDNQGWALKLRTDPSWLSITTTAESEPVAMCHCMRNTRYSEKTSCDIRPHQRTAQYSTCSLYCKHKVEVKRGVKSHTATPAWNTDTKVLERRKKPQQVYWTAVVMERVCPLPSLEDRCVCVCVCVCVHHRAPTSQRRLFLSKK